VSVNVTVTTLAVPFGLAGTVVEQVNAVVPHVCEPVGPSAATVAVVYDVVGVELTVPFEPKPLRLPSSVTVADPVSTAIGLVHEVTVEEIGSVTDVVVPNASLTVNAKFPVSVVLGALHTSM
jgi:hypothetical protein